MQILQKALPASILVLGLLVGTAASAQTTTNPTSTTQVNSTTGASTTGTNTTTTTPGLPETGVGGAASLLGSLLAVSGAAAGGAGSLLHRKK